MSTPHWRATLEQVLSERGEAEVNGWPFRSANFHGKGPGIPPWRASSGEHGMTVLHRSSIVSIWVMINWKESHVRQYHYDANAWYDGCSLIRLSAAELDTLKGVLWPKSAEMPTCNYTQSKCRCYDWKRS